MEAEVRGTSYREIDDRSNALITPNEYSGATVPSAERSVGINTLTSARSSARSSREARESLESQSVY